jgi:hypothetical protein
VPEKKKKPAKEPRKGMFMIGLPFDRAVKAALEVDPDVVREKPAKRKKKGR